MMDRTIPWINLYMSLDTLDDVPEYPLPERYGWRLYVPGDIGNWSRIETSAGEFEREADAPAKFRRYFPEDEPLKERMLFLTDGGAPFATATAWYDENDPATGMLHWVSIDADHQGQGLSRPLVSLALQRMRGLSHRRAVLKTQTASWVAIGVYRAFGFRPMLRDPSEREGWRMVSEKTGLDLEV